MFMLRQHGWLAMLVCSLCPPASWPACFLLLRERITPNEGRGKGKATPDVPSAISGLLCFREISEAGARRRGLPMLYDVGTYGMVGMVVSTICLPYDPCECPPPGISGVDDPPRGVAT
eukprot:scaffold178607_cov51-Cyclotella_meneghiniana.AAC.4